MLSNFETTLTINEYSHNPIINTGGAEISLEKLINDLKNEHIVICIKELGPISEDLKI